MQTLKEFCERFQILYGIKPAGHTPTHIVTMGTLPHFFRSLGMDDAEIYDIIVKAYHPGAVLIDCTRLTVSYDVGTIFDLIESGSKSGFETFSELLQQEFSKKIK